MHARPAARIALLAFLAPAAAAQPAGTPAPTDAVVAVLARDTREFLAAGFLVDASGHLVTVARLRDHLPPTAALSTGDEYDARLVGADARRGFAVLKVPGYRLPFLRLADSTKLAGDEAVSVPVSEGVPAWSSHRPKPTLARAGLQGFVAADGFRALRIALPPGRVEPGSPVLDGNGAVVAIVTEVSGGTATAVPSSYVAGLLADRDAERALAPPLVEPLAAPAPRPDAAGRTSESPVAPAPSTAAAAAAEEPPPPPPQPAFTLADVRKVAVFPFTSSGRVDTFWTSLFLEEWDRRGIPLDVVDPYELSVRSKDGQAFDPRGALEPLLADARRVGAQAVVIGEGKQYSAGFRVEVRLIEVNRGEVLWLKAGAASGFLGITTGPSAKKELVREVLREFPRATGASRADRRG